MAISSERCFIWRVNLILAITIVAYGWADTLKLFVYVEVYKWKLSCLDREMFDNLIKKEWDTTDIFHAATNYCDIKPLLKFAFRI